MCIIFYGERKYVKLYSNAIWMLYIMYSAVNVFILYEKFTKCRRAHLRAEREGSKELAYILCCCNLYWCSPLIFTSFLPYYTMTKLKVSTSRNTMISYKFHFDQVDVIYLFLAFLLIFLYIVQMITKTEISFGYQMGHHHHQQLVSVN